MSKNRFRKSLAWILASVLLLLFAAGCGPEGPTSPTSGTPMDGGSVTVTITQEPNRLNPFTAQAAGDKEILFNIYEGLLKPDATGAMQPALATGYAMSDDARTYTFPIRQGVVFHDGTPMTMEDVVYSLEKAAGLDGSEPRTGMDGIASVEADGDTVVLHLSEPDVELTPFLITAIVPAGTADADDTDPENVIPAALDSQPIGTGPFRFVSYTVGQDITLEKNDAYWMDGVPILDEVVFKIAADMDAAFLEMKAGNVDIFPYLSFERESEIQDLYDTREDLKNMVQIFALNNDRAPFDDMRVRQAMNLAVDRQGLLDQLNAGHGTPLTSGMSPAMGDYYNADLEGRFDRDVDEAKRLLADAGYADGFSTTVTVPSDYIFHVNTAVILAEQLKEVGIDLEINQVDWATWLETVYFGRNFDSTVIALTSEFTPKDVLNRYASEASGNFINFSNGEYDAVYATVQASVDSAERIDGYRRLQEILVDEAASVYLQDPATMVAVNRHIGGYSIYPVYVQDLSTVYRIR